MVGPITVPERELWQHEEIINPVPGPVDYIWSEVNVCRGSLIGASISSVYLVGNDVS